MASGRPLTDEDRAPWLAAIARWIDDQRAAGGHAIVACSALKRAYRDVLIGARGDVGLVFLDGARETIHTRMKARADHFMPTALLDSQIETLEPPTADENAVRVSVEGAPETILARALAGLEPRLPKS